MKPEKETYSRFYDDFWDHPRFKALIRKLGGDDTRAAGLCLKFWRLARRYWGEGRSLIPLDIWELDPDFHVLTEVGLAQVRPEGVSARNPERHFDWQHKQQMGGVERAAGAERTERGTFKKKIATRQGLEPQGFHPANNQLISSSGPAMDQLPPSSGPAPVQARSSDIQPNTNTNTKTEILTPPNPTLPGRGTQRGADEVGITEIISALRWEGDDLTAAVEQLAPAQLGLLAIYGGARTLGEGVGLAWRGCRRSHDGCAGIVREDQVTLVTNELRRLAKGRRNSGKLGDSGL